MRERMRVGPETAPAGERRATQAAARRPAGIDAILALQHSAGNHAVAGLMREERSAAPVLLRSPANLQRARSSRGTGGDRDDRRNQRERTRIRARERDRKRDHDTSYPFGAEPETLEAPPPRPRRSRWPGLHDYTDRTGEHAAAMSEAAAAKDQAIASYGTPSPIAAPPDLSQSATTGALLDYRASTATALANFAAEKRAAALAKDAVAAARAYVADADAKVAALAPQVAPPGPVAASYMSAAEIAEVADLLTDVNDELVAIRAHDGVLAGHEAALGAAPIPPATVALANADSQTRFDVDVLTARVQAARAAHLSTDAVRVKRQAMLDAAKADPLKMLGHAATQTILKGATGQDRPTFQAAIDAAVDAQHNPTLKHWLALMQMTEKSADGHLRIRRLEPVAGYKVHLSVYLTRCAAPAGGVNAPIGTVINAILPVLTGPSYGESAHTTLEYFGAKQPKRNPHHYRGQAHADPREFPPDKGWNTVGPVFEGRLAEAIDEMTPRIQSMLDRKNRDHGDV